MNIPSTPETEAAKLKLQTSWNDTHAAINTYLQTILKEVTDDPEIVFAEKIAFAISVINQAQNEMLTMTELREKLEKEYASLDTAPF